MNKIHRLLKSYHNGKKISCITGYDASIAKYLEGSQVDIVLVGDSLGQVIKGEKSTHNVSLDEIIYHTSCVRSGLTDTLLMSDLPKNSYTTKAQAYKNSKKLLSKNLADIVKLEIDTNNLDIAKYLIDKKRFQFVLILASFHNLSIGNQDIENMVKLKMRQLNCSILLWNLIRWERVLYYLSVLKINFQKK